MSKSLMDAIRQTITEGARDKTADGMTKDAEHFAHDLHKVSDAGYKHMVQKDSETKDYEKMFTGDVEKAPSRLGDMSADKDLDKYIEYNEHVEIEEAKKAAKAERGCSKDCDCDDCNDDKEDVKESLVNEDGNPNKFRAQAGGLGVAKPAPLSATQKMGQAPRSPMASQGAATPAAPKPIVDRAGERGASVATNRSSSYQPNIGNKAVKAVTGRTPASTSQIAPSGMSGSYTRSSQSGMAAATKKAGAVATGTATAPVNKTRAQAAAPSGTPTWGTQKKPSATGQMVQSVARDVRSQPGRGLNTVTSTSQIKPSGMSGNYSNKGGSATSMAQATKAAGKMAVDRNKAQGGVKVVPTSAPPPASSSSATKPGAGAAAPTKKPSAVAPVKKPGGSAPTAPAKPDLNRAQKRSIERGIAAPGTKGGFGGVTTGKTVVKPAAPKPKAPAGTNPLKSHYEFEINGTSYLVSEAHASAIAAFIEKHGTVNEMTAGEFISKEMKHPEKLTAKTRAMKVRQAFAIFKSKERRGEKP